MLRQTVPQVVGGVSALTTGGMNLLGLTAAPRFGLVAHAEAIVDRPFAPMKG